MRSSILLLALVSGMTPSFGQGTDFALAKERWYETRTEHFNIYSCGFPQQVSQTAMSLEHFYQAYSLLAGTKAVDSPPIVVMAFPDQDHMTPFLPLYQGHAGNIAGFFRRDEDENLIVLALPGTNITSAGMDVIYHEYTHLLLRHNDQIWPLWLKEGMAEMYSTFATAGNQVWIGQPIAHHLELLQTEPLMPLAELFSVAHDSAQYNEPSRQGIFYAESWLLTHFLMAGDVAAYRTNFARFTPLLQEGETTVQAFTNALHASLPALERDLARYLRRGQFAPIALKLPSNLSATVEMHSRYLVPVEVYYRLGDELLRIDRLDAAQTFFDEGKSLAPASPLPYEGLGLLAVAQNNGDEAVRQFQAAFQRGSVNFLAHYAYANERFRMTAADGETFSPVKGELADDIHKELLAAITLMPSFAPAHHLLGFFELVQGDDLNQAKQQLGVAIALDPAKPSYLLSLAQAQMRSNDPAGARGTLAPLLLPSVEPDIRNHAAELLREITREFPEQNH